MRKNLVYILMIAMACSAACSNIQRRESGTNQKEAKISPFIRINQLGFYPGGPKIAVVVGADESSFSIRSADSGTIVFSGKLSEERTISYSPTKTRVADFSSLYAEGKYYMDVPSVGRSEVFSIKQNIHHAVAKASIKSFYFQRSYVALLPEFAGKWSRPAAHPDTMVFIHPSAVSPQRESGVSIRSSKGWYDAGDYNKYIVNSGITMGTMFSAYEDFPAYFNSLTVAIPESTNDVPDLIDELVFNLRWMFTMQDPYDGGVYHKLTNAEFDGMIMPQEATGRRYVVQKSTAAALNFAAVNAQAARVLKSFSKQFPGLADSCLRSAISAFQWAEKNPKVIYDQSSLNQQHDPDINTGAYGDTNVDDEFFWAAAELFNTTREDRFGKRLMLAQNNVDVPSWNHVSLLGYYSILRIQKDLPSKYAKLAQQMQAQLTTLASTLIDNVSSKPYNMPMGTSARDFVWGSNAVAANQSIVLIYAYRLTGEKQYLDHALHNVDYLLGRNATGFSFVTGFGYKTPMHPHHRPSIADGVEEPVPGLIVGGPNPSRQDNCNYTSTIPDEAYVDHDCSYASNEIAINWNAPLVYAVGALEALQNEFGLKSKVTSK